MELGLRPVSVSSRGRLSINKESHFRVSRSESKSFVSNIAVRVECYSFFIITFSIPCVTRRSLAWASVTGGVLNYWTL